MTSSNSTGERGFAGGASSFLIPLYTASVLADIVANSSSISARSEEDDETRPDCDDPPSPHSDAGVSDNSSTEKSRRKSVGSNATVMTTRTDESSSLSDIGDAMQRHARRRFRRSLTDQDYNRFLDFLESSRCRRDSDDSIPSHVGTSDDHEYKLFLEFLQSPGCTSSDQGWDSAQVGSAGDTFNLDLILPSLQSTPICGDQFDDHLSIDFEDVGCNNCFKSFTSRKEIPRSGSTPSLTSAVAFGALAALLSPTQEKNRKSNNLWTDHSTSDDELISLSDSEGLCIDDSSSILSLMVDEWEGRVMGNPLKVTSLINNTKA